jgi:hypothetical protein
VTIVRVIIKGTHMLHHVHHSTRQVLLQSCYSVVTVLSGVCTDLSLTTLSLTLASRCVVTVLLQCCYSIVTMLLQRCYSVVAVSLQCCYIVVAVLSGVCTDLSLTTLSLTALFQCCHSVVTVLLQCSQECAPICR